MDITRGPLVDITPDQRSEFRRTGNLPEPKTEGSTPSSEAKPVEAEAKPAGDSEPPKVQEKPAQKPKQTAEERIAQLEATIEKIRKGAGKETPKQAEPSPAKPESQPQFTRPKPTSEDKDDKGNPKYTTYEDFVEDLADWKGEQRDAKNQREQREEAQTREFNAKVEEARSRYENFDEVVGPTASAINTDADVNPVVKQMLLDSGVLPDLLFTIGSDDAEMAKFMEMAKKYPGKALRYIALTESLIAEELDTAKAKPAEEAPVKPKTQAPKPPSEAGGRAAAPPDALEAAAKANDFRAFKAEATRRQLAKLKG
jgi:hypothetical protein